MEDTRLIVFKFFFLFLCVFQRAFYYFIGKIFLHRSLPIKKCLSDGNFRNFLPTEIECLLNKQSVSLCKVSKTLRIFKKTVPFKLNAVFTQLYPKEHYFEENFTLAITFYYFHICILFHLLLKINSTQRMIGCQKCIRKG